MDKKTGIIKKLGIGGICSALILSYFADASSVPVIERIEAVYRNARLDFLARAIGVSDLTFSLYSCDWATMGNVVSGFNADETDFDLWYGDVTLRLKLEEINYNGKVFTFRDDTRILSFSTTTGAITFFEDGSFVLVSSQARVQDEDDEEFRITLSNENGRTVTYQAIVDAKKVSKTENRVADYGPYLTTENYEQQEFVRYASGSEHGAMIMGWTAEDRIFGTDESDAIFGWVGPDILVGGDGNDYLAGEYGSNTLYGGRGADFFAIHSSHVANNTIFDTIADFNPEEGDVIGLSDVLLMKNFGSEIVHRYISFRFSDTQLEIFVDPDGERSDYDFDVVAKVAFNSNFGARDLSPYDLVISGGLADADGRTSGGKSN